MRKNKIVQKKIEGRCDKKIKIVKKKLNKRITKIEDVKKKLKIDI